MLKTLLEENKSMEEKIAKTWNEVIENIIFGYERWWKQDTKEKVQKLLLRVLKSKYKNKIKKQ